MRSPFVILAIGSGVLLIGIIVVNGYVNFKNKPQTEQHQREVTQEIQNDLQQEKESTNSNKTEGAPQVAPPSIRTGAVLDLSNSNLKSVPEYVFKRTDVERLDLSHNNLEGALQAEVRHLSKLRILDLSHNNFTGVPAEVGALTQLEILDLSHNKLTGLPHEIGNLKNLNVLTISGNDYSVQDLEYIQNNLPSTTIIVE